MVLLVAATNPIGSAEGIPMARSRIRFALVLGIVTVERIAATHIPAVLRPQTEVLTESFTLFQSASTRADAAAFSHKAMDADVKTANDALVSSVDLLAAELIAAAPKTRAHPFAPYGNLAPAASLKGPRSRAADQVSTLAANVLASKPKPKKAVRDAALACMRAAHDLHAAHTKLTPFNVSLKRARVERETLSVDFIQSFDAARRLAKHVWRDDIATFDSVFGAIERYRYSPKSRKKKAASAGPNPPSATQPGAGGPTAQPATNATTSPASMPVASSPVAPPKPVSPPAAVTNGAANGAGTSPLS
jgi:hypothetical protein